MKRLYVAISHHGYGHLAQTAPVLAALAARAPDLELIIGSALPREVIASRVAVPFRQVERTSDCNFVMRDALRIDPAASLAAYRAFHADWPGRVAAEAKVLAKLEVDAVFSNVGYLPLAAARRLGIPSVAMCSLNWADLFAHFFGHDDAASTLLEQMRAAYAGCRVFLRPEPSMPMADLAQAVAIPPIGRAGVNRRAWLDRHLHLKPADRLVLVGLGGIPHRLPVEDWPAMPGIVWLLPDAWRMTRPGMFGFAETGLHYANLLASADALITKPGYGSFVEAAVAGVPVLFPPRPDWPEAPWLVDWLQERARALEIDEATLRGGHLGDSLERLWAMPARPPIVADGADEAARQVLAALEET